MLLPDQPHQIRQHINNQMNMKLARIVFALNLLFLSTHPALAKSHLDSLSESVKQDLYLAQRLANNPSLYNAKYLDCYLGPRAQAISAPFSTSLRSHTPVFKTFWHDRTGQINRYKLEYSQPASDKYLAEFQFLPTRQDGLLISDMNSILGTSPTQTLDEEGQTTLMYDIEPNSENQHNNKSNNKQKNKQNTIHNENWPLGHTKIFIYQDTHLVNVARLGVQYAGPPPPPPSDADMEEANTYRRDTAFANQKLGNHDQAQSQLKSHLKAHPKDAEAHLKLAESYKAKSCINESIAEYKIALSQSGDDSDLRDQCIAGLHSLKVDIPEASIPAPATITAPGSMTTLSRPTTAHPLSSTAHPLPRINIPETTLPPSNTPLDKLEVGF